MMGFKRVFGQLIVIALAFTSVAVFVTSLLTSIYYEMHEDVDFPRYRGENVPVLLIAMACVFIVFLLLSRSHMISTNTPIIIALVFCAAYCMTLILAIKPLPVDDSKLIDNALLEFAQGNYSALTEKSGYLYIWPFQLGYFLFGETMDRLFGHGNYLVWDIIQVIVILITVFLLYLITLELFEDRRVSGIMAFLSMGMLFFYNYSTYIYGDILSMAPQTMALYLMVLYLKRRNAGYAFLSAPFIALAIMIKTNCEITLIAMVMLVLLDFAKRPSVKEVLSKIVIIAAMLVCVWGVKYAVNQHYMELTGIDSIPGGSPAVSHIMMGLQESELEDGWYNGYNYMAFAVNDSDTEKTKAYVTEELMERLSLFAHHPRYFARFMTRKFLTQWADSVCISTHNLDLVSRHVENPTELKDFIVFGKGSIILEWIMNVFMSVCYLCVVVYLITRIRDRRTSLPELLLLILIFGGIAFHQFWEGSSRYAMRYYVYWLPYAAYGMKTLLSKFLRRN